MFVVAGAAGKTGRVVASELMAEGRRVRVLVRDLAAAEAWRARGAEAEVGSLDEPRALQGVLAGADALYALVPEDLAVAEIRARRRRIVDALAAAVRASAVPHVVLLSADAALLPEGNGPVAELHYAEQQLRGASRLTALRAGYFQENVLSALPVAVEQGVYPNFFPSSDWSLPMVATRDVARSAVRCLLEPAAASELVDVIGPTYSVREAAERLGAALGKTLRVVDVPAQQHAEVLSRAGLPAEFAAALAELYACLATGRVRPAGDRMVVGTTRLDETLACSLAPRHAEVAARLAS